jgi:hypothetical protein
MAPRGGYELPSPLPLDLSAFKKMIEACCRRLASTTQEKFMKNMDPIPSITLPIDDPCRASLNLAARSLIGQFIGLWPSPKSIESWIQRNWRPLVSEGIKSHFV